MFQHFDTVIAFVVLMLVASLFITATTQLVVSLLGLRGGNMQIFRPSRRLRFSDQFLPASLAHRGARRRHSWRAAQPLAPGHLSPCRRVARRPRKAFRPASWHPARSCPARNAHDRLDRE